MVSEYQKKNKIEMEKENKDWCYVLLCGGVGWVRQRREK